MINKINKNKKTRNHMIRMESFDFMSEDGSFMKGQRKDYLVPLLLRCMLGCYFLNI